MRAPFQNIPRALYFSTLAHGMTQPLWWAWTTYSVARRSARRRDVSIAPGGNVPVLVAVHDAREYGVAVCAHADAEQEAHYQALEVEERRL